nr:immunoglobulin light chain junction region [Macaca mulatta]MOW67930.1 immunoglobulin light chain junction region [Macaca mulatta]MOW69245.1 immunoglobulin light chain junction region [Macaca mulatta]MOW69260.1 immunoglobulin light chain junction region [Macaca mulatta]MOW69866.1 immunoglobulin light chain junction region [Macaca mulatta]
EYYCQVWDSSTDYPLF